MTAFQPLFEAVAGKLKPPTLVVLGTPRLAAQIAGQIPEATAFQMDLFQAERTREELAELGATLPVVATADVWDVPGPFGSVVILAADKGERELKIDVVEQAFHVLRPKGLMAVLSPYTGDILFPRLLKKVFGAVSTATIPGAEGSAFWCLRDGERPRRRHEMTFHARVPPEETGLAFLSRPGVFVYGRLDDGARALAEVAEINPGERILDLGCGSGAVGIFAGRRAGPSGHVMFVDSHLRAVEVTRHNATTHGLPSFEVVAAAHGEGLPLRSFDVVLANPPYFARQTIARMFIERAGAVLKPGGRLYLVTRQPVQHIEPLFGHPLEAPDLLEHRGYLICVTSKRL